MDLETATPEGINEWFDEPDYRPRRNSVSPNERQEALSIIEKNSLSDKDLKNAKPLPSPDDVRKRFLGE